MTITTETITYISRSPFVIHCLKKDLINYSKLAREIGSKKKIKNIDAIIVASRRYAAQLRTRRFPDPKQLLKHTDLTIKTKHNQGISSVTAKGMHSFAILGHLIELFIQNNVAIDEVNYSNSKLEIFFNEKNIEKVMKLLS